MKITKKVSLLSLLVGVSACSHQPSNDLESSKIIELENKLKVAETQLERERAKESAYALQGQRNNQSGEPIRFASAGSEPLLPPNAKPGECYARVWVEPTYDTLTKTITVQEASESVSIIPAKYEWAEESVLVSEASTKIKKIPAKYASVSEKLLIQPAKLNWLTALNNGKPVSQELLLAAKKGGISLESAPVNSCYHEHVLPAKTEWVTEQVEVAPASYSIETTPATYRTVEKKVLVKEASSKLVKVPAKYETYTEQVIDKPAHTSWKKGSGPVQKIDEATGEIMCLVEVPATYKTVTRKRLIHAARTERVEIPAVYETVKVRELVNEASEDRITIPAKYQTVKKQRVVGAPEFVWHEVHNNDLDKTTRTGNQLCLVETPAQYKTITKTVVSAPAESQKIEIPAVYETKKVRKLVSEAREIRKPVPAVTKQVSYSELRSEGKMEWRSILCETNSTAGLIKSLQQTLTTKGYNTGGVDGLIGQKTIQAVNQYQQENNLPVDKYLNIETLRHLNLL